MVEPVQGDRIRQVRELRRFTQGDLAALVGVNQSAISHIESGRTQPSQAVLEGIASATGFPEPFFFRSPSGDFPLGSLLFRARSSASARELSEAHRWAELTYECATSLAQKFKPIQNSVPRLTNTSPRQGAEMARSALKLSPDRPIVNVMHSLEQNGAFVLGIPMELNKGDAFSTWLGTDSPTPVIIVTTGVPGDRLRFSLAHELGHLVLHHAQQGQTRKLEKEANEFASHFLMPEAGIEHELVPPITSPGLGPLKQRWGVAIQALILRARDLGVISTRRTQYLFRGLARRSGGLRREPEAFDIPIEKPRMLRAMMERAYGDPVDPRKVAADFDLPVELAAALVGIHAARGEVVATVPDSAPDKIVRFPSRG